MKSDSRGVLSRIDSYIYSHITEDISLSDLAEIAALHPNYFIPYFKKNYGVTPIEHLNNIKLNYATKMLDTDEKIQYIALKSGLNDYRYFSRLFKKKYGISPVNL